MRTLFDDDARGVIERRVLMLRLDSPRGWGQMDVAQMLAHCAIALEAATGDVPMKRMFIGRILGPFFRGKMLGEVPFSRNSPTGPMLIVSDRRDLDQERQRVLSAIRKLAAAGPSAAAKQEHGFLGRLSGDEWGRLMHKHLDHHLTQFGA